MSYDLSDLEEQIRYYEDEVSRLEEQLKSLEGQLAGARRDLSVAKNFFELEQHRLSGRQAMPYEGKTLRDAATEVLMGIGRRATSDEIAERLDAGGFKWDTIHRGRALHTALMRAPGVFKVAPNTYVWESRGIPSGAIFQEDELLAGGDSEE